MNALLLLALLVFCDGKGSVCIKATLECAVEKGAYDMPEKKATRVVADCMRMPEKKTVVNTRCNMRVFSVVKKNGPQGAVVPATQELIDALKSAGVEYIIEDCA